MSFETDSVAQRHHWERDDRRDGVDDELPRVDVVQQEDGRCPHHDQAVAEREERSPASVVGPLRTMGTLGGMRFTLKLTILGLAAYGAYTLWERYGTLLGVRSPSERPGENSPSARRIQERSELTVEEASVGSDNPVAQAKAILTDSDERSRLPRTAEGVERRRSEETVEP